MSLLPYDETRFRRQVAVALEQIRKILDMERNVVMAEDSAHDYNDKYYLAEWLTRTTIASHKQLLTSIGVTPTILAQLCEWSRTRSVTLRLQSEERCQFDRNLEREVERATRHEREYSSGLKITDKVIDTITEYFWNFEVSWELIAFQGNNVNADEKVVLRSYTGNCELKTITDKTPKPKMSVVPAMDVNITWLLQHLAADDLLSVNFSIDRQASSCKTPRRNEQTESALSYMSGVQLWSSEVHGYFTGRLFPTEPNHGLNLGSISNADVFVPVVPVLESEGGSVLPTADVHAFLDRHQESLSEQHSSVARDLSKGTKLVVAEAGKLLVSLLQFKTINQAFCDGINSIEEMLRKQIIVAVGKAVTAVDFSNYMRYHNRKVFKEMYRPKPFSYHIRRRAHYPEGVLSIEQNLQDGSVAQEIESMVRHSVATSPMRFPISSSTNVSFMGHRYVHAWIDHQFFGRSGSSLTISARARQFSSFILLVGTIGGADLFLPKFAIIIKDKDDLRLPLILETLPAAKEFRDAIESLSPEQQRFAKAYRAMQLASTLFSVVTVQIKPQMEKLMNLREDGLAKEIQLTQDLQDLFLQYQIPSDLLAFDETNNPGASDTERLQGVKDNVKAVQDMIQEAKERELKEAKEKSMLLEAETAGENQDSSRTTGPGKWGNLKKMVSKNKRRFAKDGAHHFDSADWSISSSSPSGATRSARKKLPPHLAASAAPAIKHTSNETATPPAATATSEAIHADAPPTGAELPTTLLSSKPAKGLQDQSSQNDYSQMPQAIDKKLESLDGSGSLRPTVITGGPSWHRSRQQGLLGGHSEEELLGSPEHINLRTQAFDLLDALSRGGSLALQHASMHVVLAFTHCFDRNLMDTLVVSNVNPIEQLERSSLIVNSTVQGVAPGRLLNSSQVQHIVTHSAPGLL